jgi:putative hydrolase of the HAD superfamily
VARWHGGIDAVNNPVTNQPNNDKENDIMRILNPEHFNQLPNAFLFDIDNTLYAYAPPHNAALTAVRNKVVSSFLITPNEFDNAFEESRKQVKVRLKNTASSHSRLLYFQRMLEIMGLGSQVLLALEFEQTYWSTFLRNAILFEGVKELLDDIRLLGIPTAIVTDLTAQIQFRKLIYFGLDRYFDYVVTSEEAGFDKPHELSFKIALEKIRPNGECIWMIGDSFLSDIRGSRESINAVTLQINKTSAKLENNDYYPDAYFEDYSSLRKFIEKIRGIDCK